MKAVSLSSARVELVRRRVLDGVLDVLRRGEDLTFANVAVAAGVPQRTLYRHFATRVELLRAVFDLVNERVGFKGELPTDPEGIVALVRQVFPGFDGVAPAIHELLVAPEGRLARLGDKAARQRAFLALVHREAEKLERTTARRLAAILQLLTTAGTWQTFREYWDMNGEEAAETSALAIELIFKGLRGERPKKQPSKKKVLS